MYCYHLELTSNLFSLLYITANDMVHLTSLSVPQTDQGCLLFGDDVVIYANSQRHYAASIPCSMIGGVVSPDTTSNNVVIGTYIKQVQVQPQPFFKTTNA